MVPKVQCRPFSIIYQRQDYQTMESVWEIVKGRCGEQLIYRWNETPYAIVRQYLHQFLCPSVTSFDTSRHCCCSSSPKVLCERTCIPYQLHISQFGWRDVHICWWFAHQSLELKHSGSKFQHCRHQTGQYGGINGSYYCCWIPSTELQLVYVCQ